MIVLIIRPNAVDRCTCKGGTVNETTGIRGIIRIVLNDFPLKDTEKDFVEGKTVALSLFIGVIRNAYSVMAYCLNNIFDPHTLPLERRLYRRPTMGSPASGCCYNNGAFCHGDCKGDVG